MIYWYAYRKKLLVMYSQSSRYIVAVHLIFIKICINSYINLFQKYKLLTGLFLKYFISWDNNKMNINKLALKINFIIFIVLIIVEKFN